jgi:hypothetical protein
MEGDYWGLIFYNRGMKGRDNTMKISTNQNKKKVSSQSLAGRSWMSCE